MPSCRPSLPLALCALVCLATFIGSAQSASCCLRLYKHPLHCRRLLGYTLQTINTSCDINAVIFHLSGRFVCSDPTKHWTVRAMKCVDERLQRAWVNMHLNTNSSHSAA
ncbi:C-C motif chemokine 20-like [Genypterus blacodes]|uniref:C-C motif chemokine 20-like n=1 Tax=Genypterus blacodes TaxID=154954 RepID=UPI003F76C0F1